jgi:ATP-dependent DNA ligase
MAKYAAIRDGIQSVMEAGGRRDGVTSFVAFDLLRVADEDLIGEPWTDRRKRLEDLGTGLVSPRTGDRASNR